MHSGGSLGHGEERTPAAHGSARGRLLGEASQTAKDKHCVTSLAATRQNRSAPAGAGNLRPAAGGRRKAGHGGSGGGYPEGAGVAEGSNQVFGITETQAPPRRASQGGHAPSDVRHASTEAPRRRPRVQGAGQRAARGLSSRPSPTTASGPAASPGCSALSFLQTGGTAAGAPRLRNQEQRQRRRGQGAGAPGPAGPSGRGHRPRARGPPIPGGLGDAPRGSPAPAYPRTERSPCPHRVQRGGSHRERPCYSAGCFLAEFTICLRPGEPN